MADKVKSFSLNKFKSALIGGGARPNLFEVQMGKVPALQTDFGDNFKFMCKAASLPASTIANIDVPFRGRIFKVAGDRTIETWSVTVINDESFEYRNGFEEWMQLISRLENNLGATNPEAYMTNATVIQLGKGTATGKKDPKGKTASGNNSAAYGGNDQRVAELARYQFQDIFPTNISAIDLSYDNSDQIEEFTVEFQVNSYSRLFNKED